MQSLCPQIAPEGDVRTSTDYRCNARGIYALTARKAGQRHCALAKHYALADFPFWACFCPA